MCVCELTSKKYLFVPEVKKKVQAKKMRADYVTSHVHSIPLSPNVVNKPRHVWCLKFACFCPGATVLT